jgi:hypothetical protein
MLKHIDTWCTIEGVRSLDLEMEDLILVTGRDLAKSWLVTAFANSDSGASVQIGIEGPMGNSIAVGASVFWQNAQGAEIHWGPGETITFSDPPIASTQTRHPNAPLRYQLPSSTLPDPSDRNQCVFVRGFRAKRRVPFVNWKKLQAAAEPQDLKKHSRRHGEPPVGVVREQSALSPVPEGLEIQDISGRPKGSFPQYRELISALLDYILEARCQLCS